MEPAGVLLLLHLENFDSFNAPSSYEPCRCLYRSLLLYANRASWGSLQLHCFEKQHTRMCFPCEGEGKDYTMLLCQEQHSQAEVTRIH